ncbi:MAG: hypothetical protein ACFUZC_13460 [Chthoniobacteraceae bacterium]
MQHTFFQKLFLVLLAAALVAGTYVYVYEDFLMSAQQSVNAATPKPTPTNTPR